MTVVRSSDDGIFVGFFTKHSPFSNFYRTKFSGYNSDGNKRLFSSNEQFYFAEKCLFSRNYALLEQVMRESSPSAIKLMCRCLKSITGWDDVSKEVMERGLRNKFSQNKHLLRLLFSTSGARMVEASPFDRKWGIGLPIDHADLPYPSRWKGQNWLGCLLDSVRDELKMMDVHSELAIADVNRLGIIGIFADFTPFPSVVDSPSKERTVFTASITCQLRKVHVFCVTAKMEKVHVLPLIYRYLGLPPPSAEKENNIEKSINRRFNSLVREEANLKRKNHPLEEFYRRLLSLDFLDMPSPVSAGSESVVVPTESIGLPSPSLPSRKTVAQCPESLSTIISNDIVHSTEDLLPPPITPRNKAKKKIVSHALSPKLNCVSTVTSPHRSHVSSQRSPVSPIRSFVSPTVSPIRSMPSSSPQCPPLPHNKSLSPRRSFFRNISPTVSPRVSFKSSNRPPNLKLSSVPISHTQDYSSPIADHDYCFPIVSPSVSPSNRFSLSLSQNISPILSPAPKKQKSAHMVMLPSGTTIRARREITGLFPDHRPSEFSNIRSDGNYFFPDVQPDMKPWLGAASGQIQPLPKNVKQNLSRAREKRDLYKEENSSLRKDKSDLLSDKYRLELENDQKDKIISDRTAEVRDLKAKLATSRKLLSERDVQYCNDCGCGEAEIDRSGRRVGEVLEVVAGELFETELKETPSASTVARMAFTTNAVANVHTKRILSKIVSDNKFMSIGSDETTKLYHKLQAYQLWYEDENGKRKVHNLGMKEVVSKSADVSLRTVLNILDKIEKTESTDASTSTVNSFRDIVVAQINCAMGDRASTQTRFAELLERYRAEILPKVKEEWSIMSDDERAAHEIFLSLPCQLHVIASAISPVMRALAKHEEDVTGAKDLKEESCSVNKALQLFTHNFGERASAKFGSYRIFRAWCKKNKIVCNSLPALNGNRFVIIPTIAAHIFLNRSIYSRFLSEVDIESKKSLIEALNNEIVMKHIQTLGFIDQCVTGPLWRILNSDVNTLDAHKYITAFDDWMNERVSDPSKIFTISSPKIGLPVPENTFKYSGSIMKELLSVPPCAVLERSLSDVLNAMRQFISDVLSSFTSGGKLHSISATDSVVNKTLRGMLGAAPATNMACESVFGYADFLINRAPRKRMSRVEGEMLGKRNNVFQWLDSLESEERDRIIKECIRESRQLEKESKEEYDKLNESILEVETKKAQLHEARKIRVSALDKELSAYLFTYGLFLSADDVDSFIQNEPDIQNQSTVIVKQLRYRQKILKQQPKGKKFFTVSEGGKVLSVAKLRCKLVQAIECDPKLQQNQNGNECSFQFCITEGLKASQNGPSYVLLKYDHKPFPIAMTWDYFSYLTDSQVFEEVND